MNKNKEVAGAKSAHLFNTLNTLCALASCAVVAHAQAQSAGQPFLDSFPISPDLGLTIDLVVADVDGDGALDVVEVKEAALNRVFLSDGAGRLIEAAGVGNEQDDVANAQGAAVVDLDNDGAADLVITNADARDRVYFGNGDGTFGPGNDLDDEVLDSRDVATADLDGNGFADLVIAISGAPNRIYLNDGAGGFIDAGPISPDAFDTRNVILADFDGDGTVDLLEGNYATPKMLYLGNGSGGFGAGVAIDGVGRTSFDIAAADLDLDGDVDLAEANLNSLDRYYLNDGTGVFTGFDLAVPVDLSLSIAIGDANGDTFPDILSGVFAGPNRIYLGDGAGAFGASIALTPDGRQTLAAAFVDLDGDGDEDIVEGVYGSANRIYANDPVGTFALAATFAADNQETWSAALGDVDGDGDVDILEAKRSGAPDRLYLNDGTARFGEGIPVTAGHSTNDILFVDVDNDGDLDIFAGTGGEGNRLYRNDGNGGFDAGTQVGPLDATRGIAAADLDGDGWLDLLVANAFGTAPWEINRIYFNDGAGNFPAAIDLFGLEPSHGIAAGDIDGDGDLDIVVGNYGTPNRIHLNDGFGNFDNGTLFAGDSTGTRKVALADLDGDDDLDLIAANSSSGGDPDNARDRVYFNDGTGAFTSMVLLTQDPDNTVGIEVGDVDGDGDLDIMMANSGPNRLYLNDGSGGFAPGAAIGSETLETSWLGLADFDGNGAPDLFTANFGEYGRVHLNGNPTSTGIADVTVNEDAPPYDVDLDAAFADLEDADSELFYEVVANGNPAVVTASVIGGTLRLTFAPNEAGIAPIRVRATDTDGLFVEAAFRALVLPVADSPVLLAPIPDQTATLGMPFSLGVASFFDDPDGDVLTFSAAGLPASFAIDPATGAITGTPTLADKQAAPFSIVVTASSNISNETPATDTFVLSMLDTAPPTITVLGANPALLGVGSTYVDAGATASDTEDGDLTADIVVVNLVDTATIGRYTVTYSVTDSSGNTATATRIVDVIDNAPPTIALKGASPLVVEGGTQYTDPGATATDLLDGDLTDRIRVQYAVDTMRIGTYTVTYSVTDSLGATATATRSVNVRDTTAPHLVVLGQTKVSLRQNRAYVDAGASARDMVDGDLTRSISIDNPVDPRVAREYTVTYRVTDGAGNTATGIRTVVVTPDTGGGGALDPFALLGLLLVAALAKCRQRRAH